MVIGGRAGVLPANRTTAFTMPRAFHLQRLLGSLDQAGQQTAKQLVGYIVLAWAHGVSGSGGSLLPGTRLHKI